MAQTKVKVTMLDATTSLPISVGTVELGHASDTTFSRASAGNVAVEGNLLYRAGGTDVPVADGGTGASTAQAARASLSAASFEAGAALGLLTNPFFEISQENGTTLMSAIGGVPTYAADQWFAAEDSDAVLSTQNVANPFSGTATLRRLQNSTKAIATTADAAFAAAQFLTVAQQIIEGTFWRSLSWGTADARAIDIVIIAQCSVTGTYPVSIRNAAANRSYVTTISLTANTPTVCMVTIPGDTGGTWDATTAAAAQLNVGNVAGTNWQAASLNTWVATNSLSHSSCTNWAASGTTDFFQVAYAQVFPTGVLPFTSAAEITGEALQLLLNMRRPYDVELARCKRYWQKTYPYADAVGNAYGTAGGGGATGIFVWATTSYATGFIRMSVPMRTTPTAVVYSPWTGTSGKLRDNDGAVDVNGATAIYETQMNMYVNGVSVAAGSVVYGHATLSARM